MTKFADYEVETPVIDEFTVALIHVGRVEKAERLLGELMALRAEAQAEAYRHALEVLEARRPKWDKVAELRGHRDACVKLAGRRS